MGVSPAEALLLQVGPLRLAPDVAVHGGRAMGLPEGVASGDECYGLGVVHCHPRECLPDVLGGRQRVGSSIGAFGIHIDQAHLHGAERVGEVPVAAVALIVQPYGLGSPIDVLLGFPDVLAPAAESEGPKTHRLQGDVPGKDHEVGP